MELAKKLDEMGSAFDEFKKINDTRLAEIEKQGKASADILEKMQKAQEHMDTLDGQITELKTALNRTIQSTTTDDLKDKDLDNEMKHRQALSQFLRKGVEIPQELSQWARKKTVELSGGDPEAKSMSVDSDEDGGFFVSPTMSSSITKFLYESSPVRQFANVQTISSDSFEEVYDGDEVASGWVGETQVRTGNQTTPVVKKIIIPVNEIYSNPPATQKLLDDAGVNIESWLQGKIREKFARDEATAFMSGNGNLKPRGILNYANTSEAFNQVEVSRTASASALAGDDLITLQAALKEGYQMNARWFINRLIVGTIRALKDGSTNQYLWQPGLTAGQPNMLLGKPVHFASDLSSSMAINNYIGIYGDFKGYQIVDRIGIRVLRDPYSNKPYIHFYTTKRVGGGVKDFGAFKILQCKAS